MMRNRLFQVPGIIAACTLAAGCGKKPPAAGPPRGGVPEVSVVTLQPRRVALDTELPGRVAASLTAEVRPQVSGIIHERRFTEGTDVNAGDVLYRIDPESYQAAFDAARAALAKAEAQLEPARLKATRFAELKQSEAVSQQDEDEAAAALKLTEAEIAAAKAALEAARINLDHTRVVAPISGRIGRSAVTHGALVTANQPNPLATIVRLDPVFVDVTRSSAEMLRLRQALDSGSLKAGGAAEVILTLDDGSRYPQVGELKFSEAFVDPGTGSVTLRTVFPNPRMTLLPGMFVRAMVREGERENALLVPQRGVSRNPAGEATVLTVGASGTVEPRVIRVTRAIGTDWLVDDGLQPGDRVIVEGLQKAKPGKPVKAVPFEPADPAAAASPAPARH